MRRLFTYAMLFAAMQGMALDPARIDEIAAWLPAEPAAAGARIGDRAAWDRLAALPSAAERIKAARKVLSEPIPDLPDDLYLEFSRTGNRTHYQKPYAARVEHLSGLVVAECLENKGRFLPGIVAHVEAICAERSWTLPAHDHDLVCFNGEHQLVDLGSSRRALILSFACDWLRDVLPQEVKARIVAECDRRIFQPYLLTARNPRGSPARRKLQDWWYDAKMNWNSVCNSCVVRAALAIVADRRLRAEFVASAEHTVPFALKGYTPDGYCSEGMGYWNYGFGHHLMLGLAVRAATGGRLDLFKDPKNRVVMLYPYGYQLQPGKSPHFADGGGNPSIILLALQRQVHPDITCRAAGEADLLNGDISAISLRAFGQDPGPAGAVGFDTLPPRTWFPDAQVLISRVVRPERTMSLSLAIKGGHNAELHNHNDVGSYAIMLDGIEMGGDPGGEVYTRRTFSKDRYVSKVLNSYGHPVPVVAGQLQMKGRKHAAKVLKTEFTDACDRIVLDCTAAYAVTSLVSLVRTASFDREKAEISITDQVAFSSPSAFEVPVVTYRDYTKNGDATRFAFRKPTGKRPLTMEVVSSAPVTFRDEKIENPGRPDVTRLAFAFASPVTNATFTIIYRNIP